MYTDPNLLEKARTKRNCRSKVSNGSRLFLEQIDGRSAMARRFKDLVHDFTGDLGGRDMLSEGQKQLVRRTALISSLCEQMEAEAVQELATFDVDKYVVLVNCLVCETLGLKRVPREVEITPMDRLRAYQDAKKAMTISRRQVTANPLDDLLDSFDDPSIFGEHFEDASWDSWRALTTALARPT
jgi:hypothetical protein